MKKKMYNQPIVEMADVLQPMGTICASLLNGGNTSQLPSTGGEINND